MHLYISVCVHMGLACYLCLLLPCAHCVCLYVVAVIMFLGVYTCALCMCRYGFESIHSYVDVCVRVFDLGVCGYVRVCLYVEHGI